MKAEKDYMEEGLKALRNAAFLKKGTLSVSDVLGAFKGHSLSDAEISRVYDFLAAENIRLEAYEPHDAASMNIGDLAAEAFGGGEEEDAKVLAFYEEDLAAVKPLSKTEEDALISQLLSGNPAIRRPAAERLAEGNLRWVLQLARDYSGQGVALSDLIQEGNLALWEGIVAFEGEGELGESLEKSIRQALKNLIREEAGAERAGAQVASLANRILDLVREIEEETGEAVPASVIAEKTGIPEGRVEEILNQSAKAMRNIEKR